MSYTFILSNGNSNLEFVFDPTFLTIRFYIIQYTKTTFNRPISRYKNETKYVIQIVSSYTNDSLIVVSIASYISVQVISR